jgi:hypothetical protein
MAGGTGGINHPAGCSRPCADTDTLGFALNMTGIARDAQIVTTDGHRPIQHLSSGDRIITRGQGAVTVRRIEQHSVVTRAIYILAASLSHSRPQSDSLLPSAQTVFIRDWRAKALGGRQALLLRAGDLVDGEFVRDLGLHPMTIYRVFCDAPQIIYADGLEMGTADALADCVPRQALLPNTF